MFCRRVLAVLSVAILLGLFVYLFWVPLRPAEWGGPRGQGPFEEGELPTAGRYSRDIRLHLEAVAHWRSPHRPLEATGEMLVGFHALLAAARFGFLWLLLWRLTGCGWLATLGVVAAAIPMMCGAPREFDTDIGLLLFVTLMAATASARMPWLMAVIGLPALFAFWVNAHASVLAGLAWLSVITIGRTIEWYQGSLARPTAGRQIFSLALCMVATFLNPEGPSYVVDAFRMTKNQNIPALAEWQAVDFSKPGWMPWAYLITIGALLLAQLGSRRILKATAMFVLLTFGFWPMLQQRGLAYWWLIAPWLIMSLWPRPERDARSEGDGELLSSPPLRGRGARGEGDEARWVNSESSDSSSFKPPHPNPLPRSGGEGAGKRLRGSGWIIGIAVLLAVVTTPFLRWFIVGKPRPLASIVSADTPARAALELTAGDEDAGTHLPDLRETVQTAYPNGRYRGAILAGMEQGDFLAWVLDGDNNQAVMIYTRPETLDPGHWAECQRALDGASDWWEILGRHQVNLIAVNPKRHQKLAERLCKSDNWRIVEGDENAPLLVAVRRVPKLPVELQP